MASTVYETPTQKMVWGLEARRYQCQEIAEFVNDILHTQYSPLEDTALVCGDFNISRNKVYAPFREQTIKRDSGFKDLLDQVDCEYDNTLLIKFQKAFDQDPDSIRLRLRNLVDE